MRYLKKIIKSKKIIIFDLDGVIIDSKNNMKISWETCCKKNNMNITFLSYFKFIGLPFKKILILLNIKKNYDKIKKDFDNASIKNMDNIKIFPGALDLIKNLRKNKKKVALLTSKDLKRSKKIINKFKLKFDHSECGKKKVKGKPHPHQLFLILKKFNIKASDAIYVGDMVYDLKTAKNAKVDFIYASFGYGNLKLNKKMLRINKLKDLSI
jgi:HAD superfamily hydrolase (TIGR01549 family)